MIMKAKVLVVDDLRTIRILVQRALLTEKDCQFEMAEAADGQLALEYLDRCSPEELPDVILLDRIMPKVSGDECIRIIKHNPFWSHIQVMLMTGKDDADDVVEGLSELRAEGYITKPFDLKEMAARVKVMVRIKQADDKVRKLNADLQEALSRQKQMLEEIQRAYQELKTTKVQLAETEAVAAMTKIFEKFVPKQFLQRIAKEGLETIRLGRVASEPMTILFSDIRGFTSLSETLGAERIFDFLNGYLSHMNGPIEKYNGFVDKFIGDAIMALFEHSSDQERAYRTVHAAIEMQEELVRFNALSLQRGQPAIVTGIGIHSGNVMIGTLGNQLRMDSTAIGDAVNVAARLESLTKFYQAQIIISEQIFEFLREDKTLFWRELDFVHVKGRDEPLRIYEIFNGNHVSLRKKKVQIFRRYHEALEIYHQRHWQQALQFFQDCLKIFPEDWVVQRYIERCRQFIETPPAPDWNGAVTLDHK